MTPLERFKLLAGITDDSQDGLITALLSDAEDSVRDYIGREEVPARLISVQIQLAVIAYNKRGAEGESSRSEGGISQSFDGLPPELLARLKNYPRKAGVLYTADTEQA
nr:MAG TPA_asm: Head Tail Connector Protein [Caudoviricetes sp.]